MYREFCKFLSKRFIRTFKNAGGSNDDGEVVKTAIEQDVERPIVKEASLSYIMKKAAELQIDLRKEFHGHDMLELSVIPRVRFWGILIGLPLGLSESDLEEIFDNDLNFDNYGNVDYISILNSDLFVALERRRLTAKAMKMAGKRRSSMADKSIADADAQLGASDNRKVVIEDLIFIDDLEIIIYTTVRPRTSSIFITSMQKTQTIIKKSEKKRVIELAKLGG
jgi:hypothetical protein